MWALIFISSFMVSPLYAGVVSLDLCADQWVLGLAKKEEVHSVSPLAKDAELSYLAHQTTFIKTHAGSLEALLDPTIKTVIGYEPISPTFKKLCRKRGIKLISLSYPHSFQELKKQTEFLSHFFHQPSRGDKWIRELTPSSCRCPHKAAFYGAQGLCPGKYTLLNEVLNAAGYENIYRHKEGWTHNSLESLLSPSLSALFFSDPLPPHPLWKWLKKKKITFKKIPYRLTLCPYPAAVLDLRDFLKETADAL